MTRIAVASRSEMSARVAVADRVTIPIVQNQALWSEDISDAVWIAGTGVTKTGGTADVFDPLGGNTAGKLVYAGSGAAGGIRLFQTITGPNYPGNLTRIGRVHRVSIYARVVGNGFAIRMTDNASLLFTAVTLTESWQRLDIGGAAAGAFTIQVAIYADTGDNDPRTFYVWGGQCVEANWPGLYAKTSGAAVDIGPIRSIP